jgi:hypothetical protein
MRRRREGEFGGGRRREKQREREGGEEGRKQSKEKINAHSSIHLRFISSQSPPTCLLLTYLQV